MMNKEKLKEKLDQRSMISTNESPFKLNDSFNFCSTFDTSHHRPKNPKRNVSMLDEKILTESSLRDPPHLVEIEKYK